MKLGGNIYLEVRRQCVAQHTSVHAPCFRCMAKLLNRYEKVAAASEAVLQRGFGVNGEIAQELSDALEELRK
ncbi:MAG: hypothetical protein DRJ03_00845 [Chloroflexi bacterium]|nr:MAG: hypothetical protein DRJ03_00845 [Chloroflexota bacterium]